MWRIVVKKLIDKIQMKIVKRWYNVEMFSKKKYKNVSIKSFYQEHIYQE